MGRQVRYRGLIFKIGTMKIILLSASLVCFSMVAIGQKAGLRFNSAMFEPVHLQGLTPRWKSELLPDPVADYRLFQLSHVNLPARYFQHSQALFCRLEVRMEQAANIPVKFRLGTVQYVDWLEQKRFYTNLEMRH